MFEEKWCLHTETFCRTAGFRIVNCEVYTSLSCGDSIISRVIKVEFICNATLGMHVWHQPQHMWWTRRRVDGVWL